MILYRKKINFEKKFIAIKIGKIIMKIGINQPYFLPYIGYFALMNAVDKFVYYTDVQYIRRGWVNRNRIKVENKWEYIVLPINKAPLIAKIDEIYVVNDEKKLNKIKKAIKYSYGKAPYYDQIEDLIFKHIFPGVKVSIININLTNEICNYLDIKTDTIISTEIDKDNSLKGEDKLIEICKILGGNNYINPIGGLEMYSKKKFQEANIKLNFLKINEISYPQGKYGFISRLSIIDVLMWNSKKEIKKMLMDNVLIDPIS